MHLGVHTRSHGRCALILLDSPIVHVVQREAVLLKDLPKELAAVIVVGCLIKFEIAREREKCPEFRRQALAQLPHRNILLL